MNQCQEKCGFLECINTSPIPSFLFNEYEKVPAGGGRKKSRNQENKRNLKENPKENPKEKREKGNPRNIKRVLFLSNIF